MTPEQAADLPAGRHVVGVYIGTDASYIGIILKVRLQSGETECAGLRASHVLATIDALNEWSRHRPTLDCGNREAPAALKDAAAAVLDNAPTLVASDWDVRGRMATPFLHLFTERAHPAAKSLAMPWPGPHLPSWTIGQQTGLASLSVRTPALAGSRWRLLLPMPLRSGEHRGA